MPPTRRAARTLCRQRWGGVALPAVFVAAAAGAADPRLAAAAGSVVWRPPAGGGAHALAVCRQEAAACDLVRRFCFSTCNPCEWVSGACGRPSSAALDLSEGAACQTMVRMKTFQAYLPNCHRTYSCIHCRAHLANHDELISKVGGRVQRRAQQIHCTALSKQLSLVGLWCRCRWDTIVTLRASTGISACLPIWISSVEKSAFPGPGLYLAHCVLEINPKNSVSNVLPDRICRELGYYPRRLGKSGSKIEK